MHSGGDASYATRRQPLDPGFTSQTSSFPTHPRGLCLASPTDIPEGWISYISWLKFARDIDGIVQDSGIEDSLQGNEAPSFLPLSTPYNPISFFNRPKLVVFSLCDFSLGNFRIPVSILDTPVDVLANLRRCGTFFARLQSKEIRYLSVFSISL